MARKNKTDARANGAPFIDIGIPDKDREKIALGLSRVLADTYGLYLKSHSFHWNVEGPMFNTLHLMFMAQYTELWNALDEIAERIRSLGYPAPGTNTQFAKLTSIDETEGVPDAMEMVRLLMKGHEAVARTARGVLPAANKGGDESTTDLLTQRLQITKRRHGCCAASCNRIAEAILDAPWTCSKPYRSSGTCSRLSSTTVCQKLAFSRRMLGWS